MMWFTRRAAPRHAIREIVSIGYPVDSPTHQLRATMRVSFADNGEYVYDPEASLQKLEVLADGEWSDVDSRDLKDFKADEQFMRSLYDLVINAPAHDDEGADEYTPSEDEREVAFMNSTVSQIGKPEALVHEWWSTLSGDDKIKRLEESGVMDEFESRVAAAVAGQEVRELRINERSLFEYLKNKMLGEKPAPNFEQQEETTPRETAPAQENVAE